MKRQPFRKHVEPGIYNDVEQWIKTATPAEIIERIYELSDRIKKRERAARLKQLPK